MTGPGEPSHVDLHLSTASFAASSCEVDLFGRLRSLSKAAFEQYLASPEARRASQITLVAEIAGDFVTLAADKAVLKAAEDTVTSGNASLDLAQKRFHHGIASELDVRQAQTLVDQARSEVAADAAAASQAENALDSVVGSKVPEALLPEPLDDRLMMVPTLPADLPSSVLLQRPDAPQAEHALKAAKRSDRRGASGFFPKHHSHRIDRRVSADLSSLFEGASGV